MSNLARINVPYVTMGLIWTIQKYAVPLTNDQPNFKLHTTNMDATRASRNKRVIKMFSLFHFNNMYIIFNFQNLKCRPISFRI